MFLDIHEVEDTAAGTAELRWDARWSRLNFDLNGRGVRDINAAVQDLFLGELYAAFRKLFAPAPAAQDGKPTPATKSAPQAKAGGVSAQGAFALGETFTTDAAAFARLAITYLDGANGRYEPFTTVTDCPALTGQEIAAIIGEAFGRLQVLADYEKSRKAEATLVAATLVQAALAEATLVAGFIVFSLLRAIIGKGASGAKALALAEHWSLDRKLRETCESLGIAGDEAYRVIEMMKIVLARTCPAPAVTGGKTGKAADRVAEKSADSTVGKSAKAGTGVAGETDAAKPVTAEELALDNYGAEDIRRILKVNFFEDQTWFNKEAFDEALVWIPRYCILEGVPVETVTAVAGRFRKSEAESGYTLDGLIEAATKTSGPAKPKPGKGK